MTPAVFLVVALLALPLVLLISTTGCGLDPIDVSYKEPDTPPQKPAEKPKPPPHLVGEEVTKTYSEQVIGTQGLVAYWRLDETSTTQPALDSFTKGTLNGAYVNGGSIDLSQDGIFPSSTTTDPDRAANFRLGGFVNVPDHKWLNTESVSVEFWVQWRQDLLGAPVLVGRFEQHLIDNRITRGYRVRTYTERRLDGEIAHIEATLGDMSAPLVADLGVDFLAREWHHIVMTYSKLTKTAELWVDGAIRDTESGDYKPQLLNPRPLRFAANQELLPTTFPGALDEVTIYSVALPSGDITDHFNAVKP